MKWSIILCAMVSTLVSLSAFAQEVRPVSPAVAGGKKTDTRMDNVRKTDAMHGASGKEDRKSGGPASKPEGKLKRDNARINQGRQEAGKKSDAAHDAAAVGLATGVASGTSGASSAPKKK